MSFSKTLRPALSLALSLLWPATTFAQTPARPPEVNPLQVQIEVDFVSLSTADLARSGLVFDRVPYISPSASPAPMGSFLQYATGAFTARLLQTLRHSPGGFIQAPLITTSDQIPATVQVYAQAPDRKNGLLPVQSGLTVTPRINRDGSVTLNVAVQASGDTGDGSASEMSATTLRTIRSGDVIAVAGLPFSPGRASSDQNLLVFISPTRLGTDPQGGDFEQRAASLPPSQGAFPRSETAASMDVFNADIHTVAALLERQFGLKTAVQSGSAYKPVYVHLYGASLAEVLGAVARSAGAQIIRDGKGVYVFSPLPGPARTPTSATPSGGGSSVTVTP